MSWNKPQITEISVDVNQFLYVREEVISYKIMARSTSIPQ